MCVCACVCVCVRVCACVCRYVVIERMRHSCSCPNDIIMKIIVRKQGKRNRGDAQQLDTSNRHARANMRELNHPKMSASTAYMRGKTSIFFEWFGARIVGV